MDDAEALRDTSLPLYGLDGRFRGRRWVRSWLGNLENIELGHGEPGAGEEVDVGVARWTAWQFGTPESDPAGRRFIPSRVNVRQTLATQLYLSGFDPDDGLDEEATRDLVRRIWERARLASRAPWTPAVLTVDGEPREAHRLDGDGCWVAYADLDLVLVYVISRGTRIEDLRLVRVADPAAYL